MSKYIINIHKKKRSKQASEYSKQVKLEGGRIMNN